MVESQPSKLLVAGSIPVSRSSEIETVTSGKSTSGGERESAGFESRLSTIHSPLVLRADVAQLVEHVLGKDGVSGSIPLIGSRVLRRRHDLRPSSPGEWICVPGRWREGEGLSPAEGLGDPILVIRRMGETASNLTTDEALFIDRVIRGGGRWRAYWLRNEYFAR